MAGMDVGLLTRVGPGTPTGAFFREFWMPVAMAKEVAADGPPLRLLVLGEKLLAFRDTAGRVGVIDHQCPHRCVSLFYGRNEENGIRCAYHGWKFDVDGNCLDMPNVPPNQSFANRIKVRAYRTRERNGMIWLYMGDRAEPPPLPTIGIVDDANENLIVNMTMREANWLQSYEGDIDPSHLAFLHHGNHDVKAVAGDFMGEWLLTGPAVQTKVVETEWGAMEGHTRPFGSAPNYWHYSQFLFPFWSMPGQDAMEKEYPIVRCWIPMDDTHAMNVQFMLPGGVNEQGKPLFFDKALAKLPGVGRRTTDVLLPNTSDWYGRWRISPAAENDYFIDRDMQRDANYTGIEGVQIQDKAIVESMGPIVDHAREHLTPADMMIVRTRRRLLDAVRRRQETGEVPAVLDDPSIYRAAYAGGVLASGPDADWLALYTDAVTKLGLPAPNLRKESAIG